MNYYIQRRLNKKNKQKTALFINYAKIIMEISKRGINGGGIS